MTPLRMRCALLLVALVGLPAVHAGCLSDGAGDVDAADAVADDTDAPPDGLDTGAPADTAVPADSAAADGAPGDTTASDGGTVSGTCAARCGTFGAAESCQCDAACAQFDNCCADYEALCAGGPAATDFLVAQGAECADAADWLEVTRIRDGDTVELANGEAVRFLLVDTPEISSDDCQAWQAREFTTAEVAASGTICLVTDPTSEDRDMYDRILRYVYVRDAGAGGAPVNLNVRLIRLGYGRLLYPYAYGRLYEAQGKAAQAAAEAEALGGWGVCGW